MGILQEDSGQGIQVKREGGEGIYHICIWFFWGLSTLL